MLQLRIWCPLLLPCPPPEDRPYPGIEATSLMSPALTVGFFTTEPPRAAHEYTYVHRYWTCVQRGHTAQLNWTRGIWVQMNHVAYWSVTAHFLSRGSHTWSIPEPEEVGEGLGSQVTPQVTLVLLCSLWPPTQQSSCLSHIVHRLMTGHCVPLGRKRLKGFMNLWTSHYQEKKN